MKARLFLMALVLAAAGSEVDAQTVVARARLGHTCEDLTAIGHDPVAVDGWDVVRYGPGTTETIADLRDIGVAGIVTGVTYVESEKLLAFISPNAPDQLVLAAPRAARVASSNRTITYLGGYLPGHVEGLGYLGDSAPFADHIALVAYDDPNLDSPRIEILRRDGQVVHEIFPAAPLSGLYLADVAPRGDGRLLVSAVSNQIWTIDYAGNVLEGPVVDTDAQVVEGLAALADGRVATLEYASGRVYMHRADLTRLPAEDRRNDIGFRTTALGGIAWNPATGTFLTRSSSLTNTNVGGTEVMSVNYLLDDAARLFMPSTCGAIRYRAMSYLPDENRSVLAHVNLPRELHLFDDQGCLVEAVDVSALGRPSAVEYVAPTQQFAVRFLDDPTHLQILSRAGAHVRDIDAGAVGIGGFGAVAYFNPGHPSGGELLLARNDGLAARVDFHGSLVASYDLKQALHVSRIADLAYISTGPLAGSFALVDSWHVEVVVFRID